MTKLEEICKHVRDSLDETPPPEEVPHTPIPWRNLFAKTKVNIIAEVKFASPSEGLIRSDLQPEEAARAYLEHGARALSVLTERRHFRGDISFLSRIRKAFPDAPLLMKDFIVDERQIHWARLAGADAVLLIVNALGDDDLKRLHDAACERSLTPLVEVHDEEELERAHRLGATLIGVNNRNLKTMAVSLDVARRLSPASRDERTYISESGVQNGDQIRGLRSLGYDGFLVGTALMKQAHPGHALAKLIAETGYES